MSFYKKLVLSYHGERYSGWQIQPNVVTVQGELNAALKTMAKGEEIKTLGSGRTDAKVHGLGQVVKVDFPFAINNDAIKNGLNSLLPTDIRIQHVEDSCESFHPVRDAVSKTYLYQFVCYRPGPFFINRVSHCPYILDEVKLKNALNLFIGEHDFANFFTVGTPTNSTVRSIYKAKFNVTEQHDPITGVKFTLWSIEINGSGFLKQMVRLIVGSLWAHACGKISLADIEDSLAVQTSGHLAPVAPAEGLYLKEVIYE